MELQDHFIREIIVVIWQFFINIKFNKYNLINWDYISE